ncbi:DUF2752 domain-containing protein [Streptacidiphilus sp. MAP5-3]|uniref:DUF2752 domain-containing protein n=1 Tax=unclassified Streptacidiphilus TaxID=2643834 RepID=UPI0035164EBA
MSVHEIGHQPVTFQGISHQDVNRPDTGTGTGTDMARGLRAAWKTRWSRITASRWGGPVRVLLRGSGAGVLAVAAAEVHATHDPGVLCPFRRFTGIPCPVCGSTTVFMELGAGHPVAAVAANPVTVLIGLGLLFAPLGGGAWWWRLPARKKNIVIFSALGVSWLWQLHRYGFLPS